MSTVDHETRKQSNWQAYVHNYKSVEKINFNKLLDEFKQFEVRKKKVEDKFYELYDKRVDIKNVKYILNSDQDHRVNIIDFELIRNEVNI